MTEKGGTVPDEEWRRKQLELAERQKQYVIEQMQPLLHGTIVWVGTSVDDDPFDPAEVWPTFQVRTPAGQLIQVEVSRDEEGNGPGWLFIGEVPAEAHRGGT